MTRTLTPLLTALFLVTAPMAHAGPLAEAAAPAASMQEKVVYHVNDSANASAALRNIKNHLSADPDVKIVVVTHSQGIDFLLADATDKNGNPYEPTVQELKSQGVDFRVCNNTLKSRKIDPGTVLAEATIVPSGVAEIGRLQAKEGYVYLKP
jgi:intracellular sulfur oxidation DsrE/DsrF family protein